MCMLKFSHVSFLLKCCSKSALRRHQKSLKIKPQHRVLYIQWTSHSDVFFFLACFDLMHMVSLFSVTRIIFGTGTDFRDYQPAISPFLGKDPQVFVDIRSLKLCFPKYLLRKYWVVRTNAARFVLSWAFGIENFFSHTLTHTHTEHIVKVTLIYVKRWVINKSVALQVRAWPYISLTHPGRFNLNGCTVFKSQTGA